MLPSWIVFGESVQRILDPLSTLGIMFRKVRHPLLMIFFDGNGFNTFQTVSIQAGRWLRTRSKRRCANYTYQIPKVWKSPFYLNEKQPNTAKTSECPEGSSREKGGPTDQPNAEA
jgi:hypothetical protein